jgi:hypothetical protein
MKSPINILAVIGLTFGGVFGMAGSFTANPHLQASLWAIDSAGLVMATALLALKYFRTGHDLVAGGFLVFAIAEAVLMSGTAAGPAASIPAFAAGTALWASVTPIADIRSAHRDVSFGLLVELLKLSKSCTLKIVLQGVTHIVGGCRAKFDRPPHPDWRLCRLWFGLGQ